MTNHEQQPAHVRLRLLAAIVAIALGGIASWSSLSSGALGELAQRRNTRTRRHIGHDSGVQIASMNPAPNWVRHYAGLR